MKILKFEDFKNKKEIENPKKNHLQSIEERISELSKNTPIEEIFEKEKKKH